MQMIKLSDGCHVASDDIAEVRINESAQTINVRMKNGIGHSHSAPYRMGVYGELDRLVAEINEAEKA